jgi:uncharacterized protein with von Willebrand factor type A (vWA) domain
LTQSSSGHLLQNIVLFGRLLRSLDVDVTPPQIVDFVGCLDHLDLRQRQDVKNAGRSLLVSRPEHLYLYDRAFDLFWQAWAEDEQALPALDGRQPGPDSSSEEETNLDRQVGDSQSLEGEPSASQTAADYAYSAHEVLRSKDFAKLTPEELAEVRRTIHTMAWELEPCRARRKTSAPRRHALDMRRTLRQNLRYGCEPLTLAWRRPKLKRRPLVVICDVSGSMEHYSRLLLKFIYVIGNCLDKVEAFVFSTRLTRITRQIQCGDVDAGLDQVAASIQDWGSGTRLGEALKTFNYEWGRRLLGRGAVVLLVSDGLDRGDLDLLEREMRRLQLCCHRLIWLNPLLGSTDYRPLAGGMRTALPYVDDFLPVHNLASLEHLGHVLERLGSHPGSAPVRGLTSSI